MSTATYKCLCCGDSFTARVADRNRGWAKFCSKSCKAKKQEANSGQNRGYLRRTTGYGADRERLCFPSHAEDEIQ